MPILISRSRTRLRLPWTFALLALLALHAFACDDERRGEAGESCTRAQDCEESLRCIAGVCREDGDLGTDTDASTEPAPTVGQEGDACSSRRDCALGLICVAERCEAASNGVSMSSRYSGVGETCRASNDCAEDLVCMTSMCTSVTLALPHTGKECHRVECEEDADCCSDFVPNENCAAYEENCRTDPVFCATYRSLCECSQRCEDSLCVAAAPGCSDSAECTSTQTPFCVSGSCAQCERDANCPGDGTKCVEGVCAAACQISEQCPPLHACEEGECIVVGCQTDRECVFLRGDPQSRCVEGDCITPCDADSDCSGEGMRFFVCLQGECTFVGCETDAECRAFLGLNLPTSMSTAVCR